MNENQQDEHPSLEKRDLHPKDRLLRENGFKIYARHANGTCSWTKDGKLYTQQQALDEVKFGVRDE